MAIKRILLPFCDNGDVKPIAEAAFHIGRLLSAQVRGLLGGGPIRSRQRSGNQFRRK